MNIENKVVFEPPVGHRLFSWKVIEGPRGIQVGKHWSKGAVWFEPSCETLFFFAYSYAYNVRGSEIHGSHLHAVDKIFELSNGCALVKKKGRKKRKEEKILIKILKDYVLLFIVGGTGFCTSKLKATKLGNSKDLITSYHSSPFSSSRFEFSRLFTF